MKKKFAKLSAILLVITMLFSMFSAVSFVSAEETTTETATETTDAFYEKAITFLMRLGIFQGDDTGAMRPDDSIKRSEMAAVLLRAQNLQAAADAVPYNKVFDDVLESHWAAGVIQIASGSGMINGMGDGTFHPDDPVTYEQAVKMIVCTLGYEDLAQDLGGYPLGYVAEANELGVTKNAVMNNKAEAPRSTVAKLIYNALNIDIRTKNGNKYDVNKGETLLTEKLDVYKGDGKVRGVYTDRIDAGITLKENEVDIEGDVYLKGKASDVKDFLGTMVTFYYSEDDVTGERELVHVELKTSISSLSVPVDDIQYSSIKFDRDTAEVSATLTYYPEGSSKTKTAKIENAKIYYNGNEFTPDDYAYYVNNPSTKVVPNFADIEDLLTPEFGSVVFYDTNNQTLDSINRIFITDYDVYVVSTVSSSKLTTLKTDTLDTKTFSINDDDVTYNITKDGKAATYKDIKKFNVVTIATTLGDKDKVVTIDAVSNKVNGEIEATTTTNGKKEITIDGKDYKVLDMSNFSTMKIGSTGDFYMTSDNKIAYFEVGSKTGSNKFLPEGHKYAWIVDAYSPTSTGFETQPALKLFTQDGKMLIYHLDKKVKVMMPTEDDFITVDAEYFFGDVLFTEGSDGVNINGGNADVNLGVGDGKARKAVMVGSNTYLVNDNTTYASNRMITFKLENDNIKEIIFPLKRRIVDDDIEYNARQADRIDVAFSTIDSGWTANGQSVIGNTSGYFPNNSSNGDAAKYNQQWSFTTSGVQMRIPYFEYEEDGKGNAIPKTKTLECKKSNGTTITAKINQYSDVSVNKGGFKTSAANFSDIMPSSGRQLFTLIGYDATKNIECNMVVRIDPDGDVFSEAIKTDPNSGGITTVIVEKIKKGVNSEDNPVYTISGKDLYGFKSSFTTADTCVLYESQDGENLGSYPDDDGVAGNSKYLWTTSFENSTLDDYINTGDVLVVYSSGDTKSVICRILNIEEVIKAQKIFTQDEYETATEMGDYVLNGKTLMTGTDSNSRRAYWFTRMNEVEDTGSNYELKVKATNVTKAKTLKVPYGTKVISMDMSNPGTVKELETADLLEEGLTLLFIEEKQVLASGILVLDFSEFDGYRRDEDDGDFGGDGFVPVDHRYAWIVDAGNDSDEYGKIPTMTLFTEEGKLKEYPLAGTVKVMMPTSDNFVNVDSEDFFDQVLFTTGANGVNINGGDGDYNIASSGTAAAKAKIIEIDGETYYVDDNTTYASNRMITFKVNYDREIDEIIFPLKRRIDSTGKEFSYSDRQDDRLDVAFSTIDSGYTPTKGQTFLGNNDGKMPNNAAGGTGYDQDWTFTSIARQMNVPFFDYVLEGGVAVPRTKAIQYKNAGGDTVTGYLNQYSNKAIKSSFAAGSANFNSFLANGGRYRYALIGYDATSNREVNLVVRVDDPEGLAANKE